jgi:signal transduction histidine kinase
MVTATADATLPLRKERGLVPRGLDRVVTLLAVGLLAAAVVPQLTVLSPPAAMCALAPLILWAVSALLPAVTPNLVAVALLTAVVLSASVAAAFVSSLAGLPGLFALIGLLAAPAVGVVVGVALAVAAAAVIGGGAVVGTSGVAQTLITVGALGAGVAVGLSRRESRASADRERESARELVRAHQALALSAATEERRRIARNLHDVLAHSLGALVIQLDAVEALLDAGRVTEARARAAASRRLAADGLAEARSAVRVLNEGDVDASVLRLQVDALVRTERELGATVSAELEELEGSLSPAEIVALHSAAREALTNARKHAPDGEVRVTLRRSGDAVTLVVSNALTAGGALSRTGGGRGLMGLRERFAALERGRFDAVAAERAFTVTAEVSGQ